MSSNINATNGYNAANSANQAYQSLLVRSLPTSAPSASGAIASDVGFDLSEGVTAAYMQTALTTRIGTNVQDALGKHGLDGLLNQGAQSVATQDPGAVDPSSLGDWSPEATSDRIVAFTTGMLGIFAKQNPNLSKSDLIDKFEKTIRDATSQGYFEAKSILENSDNVDAGIASIAQQTMDLVAKKFDSYFADLRSKSGITTDANAAPTTKPSAA